VTSACAEHLIKLPSLRYLNLWCTQVDTGCSSADYIVTHFVHLSTSLATLAWPSFANTCPSCRCSTCARHLSPIKDWLACQVRITTPLRTS